MFMGSLRGSVTGDGTEETGDEDLKWVCNLPVHKDLILVS